jgi:hypothetical protein
MVNVPLPVHAVEPVIVQVPVITPSLSTLVFVLMIPLTVVLVRVRVLPPEFTVIDIVPVTWPAELALRSDVPLSLEVGGLSWKHDSC